ncbi:MAG TPA: KOW domain-containing RNA-binding protein [Candidatus Gemmiger stercoravium]|nr:KOW domain-containing RNA-binding protein [Candidatus Gemmiger stercoravium]
MDFVKGRLVRSKAGRDKTRTFAVVAVQGQMLLLANGARRPLTAPKRKKAQHVAPTATILANELLQSDQLLSEAIAAYDAAHPR